MNTLTLTINHPLYVSLHKQTLLLFMSKDIYCGTLHVPKKKKQLLNAIWICGFKMCTHLRLYATKAIQHCNNEL